MTTPHSSDDSTRSDLNNTSTSSLLARGAIGGILLGFSTTVPGLSSGAMLFISGVYKHLVAAIAELTGFKFRLRSIMLLSVIAAVAGVMVLFVAGLIVELVTNHRWMMYSLFFGLSLGGFELMLRRARPIRASTLLALAAGVAAILLVRYSLSSSARGTESNYLMIGFSGFCAAAAVLTPGLDGNSLMLGLGYYEVVMRGISTVKSGLLGSNGSGFDLAVLWTGLKVCIPFGLGACVALLTVSHLMRWLLARHEKSVMGVLLGLLLGSLVTIYPFQQAAPPALGSDFHGATVTQEFLDSLSPEQWPIQWMVPTGAQIAAALGLIILGFGITRLFELLDKREPDAA